jgi:hypothetical protein
VVRLWEKSGIGATDPGMRVLGLLAGTAILAALWRNARRFGQSTPVVSIALLTFTSSVICYGDSIRAYGLGMFLGLCTIGVIWDVAQTPTRARFAIALVVALLSVHMLFYNCILLLAACCGAAAVTLPKRQWKRTSLIFLIGFICAISMLAYVPMIQRTRGEMMFKTELDFSGIISRLRESLQFATDGGVARGNNDIIWGAAIAASILVALGAWCAGALKSASQRRRDLVLFCATYLVVGILAYWGFLKILRYSLQPWYFLAAIAMVAAGLDGLFSAIESPRFRVLLAAFAAGFAFHSGISVWQNVGVRRTNADLVAADLGKRAAKGDVIVIAPWYLGVSFQRYYHGEGGCIAIPPVSFFDYQEYDLLTRFMKDRRAMDPVMGRISSLLQSGRRVWVVSNDIFPSSPPTPFFQRRPDPDTGWHTQDYLATWDHEVLYFLRQNSKEVLRIKLPKDPPVSDYEAIWLTRMEGWKETPRSDARPE